MILLPLSQYNLSISMSPLFKIVFNLLKIKYNVTYPNSLLTLLACKSQ